MKKIFAFEKDKNRLKLLLFYVKEDNIFIEDYRQQEIGIETNASVLIKKFLADNNAAGFKTICFLPLSSIYLRKLTFPYRKISKIKNSIRFAIEPHIPLPVETMKVFFQPIYAKSQMQSTGMDVLSFVVPEILLNEQLEIISSSGLICSDIELIPLSIFDFLISKNKITENALLVHVGSDTTYIFSALDGGRLADLRQIAVGRSDIDKEKDELKREISTILISRDSSLSGNKISAIYVSGLSTIKTYLGGAAADRSATETEADKPTIEDTAGRPATETKADRPEVCDWLAQNFNVPVNISDFDEVFFANKIPNSEQKPLSEDMQPEPLSQEFIPEILYAGLASGRTVLNFYPPTLQEKEKKGMIVSLALALFILAVVAFRIQFERNIYERKLVLLNSRIDEIFSEAFPDASDKRTPLLQMKAAVKSLKDTASSRNIISFSPLEALREISQNLGKDLKIELDSFRTKENEIIIAGNVSSYGDIDKIRTALEGSALFSRVEIESAQTTAQGVIFRLRIITK